VMEKQSASQTGNFASAGDEFMPENGKPDLEAAYSLSSPDDNRKLYRDWAATYDEDFARRGGYRFPCLIAEAFKQAGGTGPVIDIGCGTGLVADYLPTDLEIDGLDISPEMLTEAARKGRYRDLIEADLTRSLAIPDTAYGGLTSAGTFTHGHVGPDALWELMRILRSGSVCAISGNPAFFEKAKFGETFDKLVDQGIISHPEITEEPIYDKSASPPEGHENDIGYVIVFHRM
jgi:SAM-dependent methyltransferase